MSSPIKNIENLPRVILYDGDCGLCNSMIQFILKNKTKDFYFISLHSKIAQDFLQTKDIIIQFDTIYYFEDGLIYKKSQAIRKIAKNLSFFYRLLEMFSRLFPTRPLDYFYTKIAE